MRVAGCLPLWEGIQEFIKPSTNSWEAVTTIPTDKVTVNKFFEDFQASKFVWRENFCGYLLPFLMPQPWKYL